MTQVDTIEKNILFGEDPKKIDNHPVRVFEASKSIIGLDLDNPSYLLLDYLKRQKLSDDFSDLESNIPKTISTVSIYQLEEAIKQSDYEKCIIVITNLLNLSDGKQKELSLKEVIKLLSA